MQNRSRTLKWWLQDNWLELILVLVFLAALGWVAGTGASLLPEPTPEPTPTPTALPAATALLEAEGTVEPQVFDGVRAQGYVIAQTSLGPRPAGSESSTEAGTLIAAELRRLEWDVQEQVFEADGVQLRNLVAEAGQGPLVLLTAHYDTRLTSPRDPDPRRSLLANLGANDNASGVAVLMELAHALDRDRLNHRVRLAFLEGEAMALEPRSWAYGPAAQVLSETLALQPELMVILNMVGGTDQQLFFESYSDAELRAQLWAVAEELGYARWFVPEVRYALPETQAFLDLGIPVVNLIDLDYPYWDTMDDTPDKISSDSLEQVGRVLEVYLEGRADR